MSDIQTSVPDPSAAPATDPAPGGSFFGHLFGLYLEPRTAYTSILRRASQWWLPLLGCLVLNAVFIGVWLHKMDPHAFVRTQIEESGQADKIPGGIDDAVEKRAPFVKPFTWGIGMIAPLVVITVMAAVLLFIFRFFYEGQLGFGHSMSVVAWQGLALATITVPLLLGVMAAKGDWNVDPGSALGANLTLFLEKGQTAHWLYALAGSVDLFTLWSIFLLACGYGVLVRKPTASALWGVLIPWLVLTVVKVGFVALTRG